MTRLITFVQNHWQLLILIALIFTFWRTVPLQPLRVLIVFLHELSHAIVLIATGGEVVAFSINAQEGGQVMGRGGNRFLTLTAGYLGSLLIGIGLPAHRRAFHLGPHRPGRLWRHPPRRCRTLYPRHLRADLHAHRKHFHAHHRPFSARSGQRHDPAYHRPQQYDLRPLRHLLRHHCAIRLTIRRPHAGRGIRRHHNPLGSALARYQPRDYCLFFAKRPRPNQQHRIKKGRLRKDDPLAFLCSLNT